MQEECVSFRMDLEDRMGLVHQISQKFSEHLFDIIEASIITLPHKVVSKWVVGDRTKKDGYHPLLSVCRDLQNLDWCNYLCAQFGKFQTNEGEIESVPDIQIASNMPTPFESFYSGQAINRKEALHPDNAPDDKLTSVFYELNKAAADFIKDPNRIFLVSPKDLEKIIAEIYRGHGFDVKVSGGPRDHGIDVKATAYVPMSLPRKLGQHMRIGIQVKRYGRKRRVSEKELRDLYGSIMADNFDRGVLITTSSLTASAREYIESRRPVQDRIAVIAEDEVIELLISYCKQKWIPFWK